jgi:ABC-2 type transport system ATP-binding protein
MHRPRVLLLDEPTAGLDPASRGELLARLRGLVRDEAITVLWATHLREEGEGADRILQLEGGRLVGEPPR